MARSLSFPSKVFQIRSPIQKIFALLRLNMLDLLSRDLIYFLGLFFSIGGTLLLLPYHWDQRTARLSFIQSKARLSLYMLVVTWYTCDTLYGSLVVQRLSADPNSTFEDRMKVNLHNLTRGAALVLHFFFLIKRETNSDFFNTIFSMERTFNRMSI